GAKHTASYRRRPVALHGADTSAQVREGRIDTQGLLEHLGGDEQRDQPLLEAGQAGGQLVNLNLDVVGVAPLAEVGELGPGHPEERQHHGVPVLAGGAFERSQQGDRVDEVRGCVVRVAGAGGGGSGHWVSSFREGSAAGTTPEWNGTGRSSTRAAP